MIRVATPHRTADTRFAAPTPTIAPLGDEQTLVLFQPFHRYLELGRGPCDEFSDQGGTDRGVAGPENVKSAGGAVYQIHHVVQPGGQKTDVLPVQGGDEDPVEAGHDVVSDLVGLVL